MEKQDKTTHAHFDWRHEKHSWGAVALAAKKLVVNKRVCFDVYDDGPDNTLVYKGTFHFGKAMVHASLSLRMNVDKDLLGPGSHSIITTDYTNAINDSTAIAARLMLALRMEGKHIFIG